MDVEYSRSATVIFTGIALTLMFTLHIIATAVMLFGLSSGAALATVVGVLIEVPLMLMLVGFCKRTTSWFEN